MAYQLFDLHTGARYYYPPNIEYWEDDPAIPNTGKFNLENGDTIKTPYGSTGLIISLIGSGNKVLIGNYDINGNHGLGRGNISFGIVGDNGSITITIRGSNSTYADLLTNPIHGGVVPSWYNHDEKGSLVRSSISLGDGNNTLSFYSRGTVAKDSSIVIGSGINTINLGTNYTPYGYGDQAVIRAC